jgi:hypothetical protein
MQFTIRVTLGETGKLVGRSDARRTRLPNGVQMEGKA